ncbi:hypothetical protein BLD48_11280 [Exiguobacterium sp. KRL4]|uniref:hypothetical protein n=1 Tax=Exiguobacterium sp. KRL4 TaxID=1914536 RepID=UPI0008F899A6|nr:hypothetical protein [Exiguobacterium sp. KRL4]OIN66373.1 hypothetical protein BLD48_11280 [Exiguobacterium sp. KRL4]
MIDHKKQIEVLLYRNPLQFACETLGVPNMRNHSYADVFTVSRAEVLAYTAVNGIPEQSSTESNRLLDGFHYYEERGTWYTFFRERGMTFDQKNFSDETIAKEYIVSMLLKLTMTGLY